MGSRVRSQLPEAMIDGSQTIAWVDRRVGALTEARIEARQAIMRNTVEEALERLKAEQHNFAMMRALGMRT